MNLVEISGVGEFPRGLPPSPEGHFAAGSLLLSLALRVAGELMCLTNERVREPGRGQRENKNSRQIIYSLFHFEC